MLLHEIVILMEKICAAQPYCTVIQMFCFFYIPIWDFYHGFFFSFITQCGRRQFTWLGCDCFLLAELCEL